MAILTHGALGLALGPRSPNTSPQTHLYPSYTRNPALVSQSRVPPELRRVSSAVIERRKKEGDCSLSGPRQDMAVLGPPLTRWVETGNM